MGSLSETMDVPNPWYLKIWDIKSLAMWCALIVFLTGIKCVYLLKQSTIVQILVFPCMDLGNPKIKSIEILSHGAFGIGRGCNKLGAFPLSY